MKIAILGGSAQKKTGALELGREWEMWLVNGIMQPWFSKAYRRIDKCFHLHQYAPVKAQIPEHISWFEEFARNHDEIEFVLLEPFEALPQAKIFPRDKIAASVGGRIGYHCGSFDWMLTYAMYLGATDVRFFGVQLHTQSGEPMSSGPCLEYWTGFAEGRGVRVTFADDCDLFYNYRLVRDHRAYGYDEFDLVETVK